MDAEGLAEPLVRIRTIGDIATLPPGTDGVLAEGLTDAGVAELAARQPALRHLFTDGNVRVTDDGLAILPQFTRLETLDLEWSAGTDKGLSHVASVRSLRWVDLGGCAGVTGAGLSGLRGARPDLIVPLFLNS